MYLKLIKPTEPTRSINQTAMAPAFCALLNTLGELWEVPDDYTLEVHHLEMQESFAHKEGDPYTIIYLRHDSMSENAHPKDLKTNWIRLSADCRGGGPTAACMEMTDGQGDQRMNYIFHMPSVYHQALRAAHFLFDQHIDLDKINEINVFNEELVLNKGR